MAISAKPKTILAVTVVLILGIVLGIVSSEPKNSSNRVEEINRYYAPGNLGYEDRIVVSLANGTNLTYNKRKFVECPENYSGTAFGCPRKVVQDPGYAEIEELIRNNFTQKNGSYWPEIHLPKDDICMKSRTEYASCFSD